MLDDPTEINVGINPGCGTFWEAEVQVAPGVAVLHGQHDYECQVFDPIAAGVPEERRARRRRHDPDLKGPVDCAKKATIALYRLNGAADRAPGARQNCKTLPPPAPKCDNGKDDDGDGLVDSRDSAGTTDPDPGCSGIADTTEDSEVPTPDSCQVRVGYFGDDKSVTGLLTSGCGVLKGAWFRPPGPRRAAGGRSATTTGHPAAPKAATIGVTFG